MKDIVCKINDNINEGKNPRYCVNVIIPNFGHDRRMTDDWKSLVKSEWCKKAKYYEVMDMTKPNFTDLDALIEWHGEHGYWANLYDNNKAYKDDPENAPKWVNIISKKDLEELEKKKK